MGAANLVKGEARFVIRRGEHGFGFPTSAQIWVKPEKMPSSQKLAYSAILWGSTPCNVIPPLPHTLICWSLTRGASVFGSMFSAMKSLGRSIPLVFRRSRARVLCVGIITSLMGYSTAASMPSTDVFKRLFESVLKPGKPVPSTRLNSTVRRIGSSFCQLCNIGETCQPSLTALST